MLNSALNLLKQELTLTEHEVEVLVWALRQGAAFQSFYRYFKETVLRLPGFMEAPHHRRLCRLLQDVYDRKIKKLMIFAPPRTGKTIMTATAFPSWYLSKRPQSEVVIACYNQEYGAINANGTRLQFEHPFHCKLFPMYANDYAFRYSQSDKWAFRCKRGKDPNLRGVGIGSALTGSGANLLIIDDYIKDPEAAYSPTIRENAWKWYTHVASTRLDPLDNAQIIIGTPWHPDDLAHRIINAEGEVGAPNEEGKEEWTVVRIRATDENGKSFWQERFSDEYFAQRANLLGPSAYSALFLGRPVSDEGCIYDTDWWKFYDVNTVKEDVLSQSVWVYASWDTAMKEKEHNDYTACTVWLSLQNGHYLLDMFEERLRFTELKQKVMEVQDKWNVMYHLIEDKASGISLIQELQDGTRLNLISYEPTGPKYERIKNASRYVRGGNVYLPAEFATYNGELTKTPTKKAKWLMEKMRLFPFTDHDDIQDSFAQYLNYINDGVNTVKYADIASMFPSKSKRRVGTEVF